MKIGHISDLHWLDMHGARVRDFFNKRWIGGLNLLAGRARKHTQDAVLSALDALKRADVDHVVLTGDLTNLALNAEFHAVKDVLNRYFDDSQLTIVPGNHDFYTRESGKKKRFESIVYRNGCPGELDLTQGNVWPFVRLRGDVAIIGLNSALPRAWFVAGGRLGEVQLLALEQLLQHPEVKSRFKIVALHHHLFRVVRSPGERWRHLDDRKAFLDICQKYNVDLIIHGHNHDFTQMRVGNVLISEAGSCSVSFFKHDNRAGKFNIYEIENKRLQSVQTYQYDQGAYHLWRTALPSDFRSVDRKDL